MTTVQSPPSAAARDCPKCGHVCEASTVECPRCQVILDKAARTGGERHDQPAADEPAATGSAAERLATVGQLLIRQSVERWEVFTGFETANRYSILDEHGHTVFLAAEESGSWSQLFLRLFLKAMRPFRIHIRSERGEAVLTLDSPFRFYFHELDVCDAQGRVLGNVRMRFSLVNRIYSVYDNTTGLEYELFGPMWRPWTFHIKRNGMVCGEIRKKWSGLAREFFSDADFFGIEFPHDIGRETRAVLLGAVFLIDFVHFEDNNKS